MENFPSNSDLKNLVRELSQGKDLAKQLQNHLNLQSSSSSSSHENREILLQRIMYSYDQALSMLMHNELAAAAVGGDEAPAPAPTLAALPKSESPWLVAGSLQSDDSDQDLTDQASMKRKKHERWSEKVKVRAEVGVEGQFDDGHVWRKYGQKEILGAKHPRGYYRCTYRHANGCLATKQIQRSDEDPTLFDVTYRQKHTCNLAHATSNPPVPISISDPLNHDPNPLTQYSPFNIQTTLAAQDLDTSANPFNFSSPSAIVPINENFFSDSKDVLRNYHPISTDDWNDGYGELIPNSRHSDSELGPIGAAMTSASGSATVGPDFPFGPSGFGSGFDFRDDTCHFP